VVRPARDPASALGNPLARSGAAPVASRAPPPASPPGAGLGHPPHLHRARERAPDPQPVHRPAVRRARRGAAARARVDGAGPGQRLGRDAVHLGAGPRPDRHRRGPQRHVHRARPRARRRARRRGARHVRARGCRRVAQRRARGPRGVRRCDVDRRGRRRDRHAAAAEPAPRRHDADRRALLAGHAPGPRHRRGLRCRRARRLPAPAAAARAPRRARLRRGRDGARRPAVLGPVPGGAVAHDASLARRAPGRGGRPRGARRARGGCSPSSGADGRREPVGRRRRSLRGRSVRGTPRPRSR
jgi:hypothetical protein